jgi:CRISPR-associated protein Cmr1
LRVSGDMRKLTKAQLPAATAGHQYLLGQGLYHFKDNYLREALASDSELRIRVRFRPGTTQNERDSVARALLTLGLLGGLGSRARKGFGALAIQTLNGTDLTVPNDVDALRQTLADLTADRLDTLPPYTAFSQRSRIDLVPATHRDVWRLLGEIGGDMQRYRSFGQNGKVAGQPAERNFTDDHDLAQGAAVGNLVDRHPRRAVFGLPHNYFFSSTKDKADINAVAPKSDGSWSDIGANRRASPLFVHPHRFPDGAVVGVLTLLPAQFLPDEWRIGIKGSKGPVRRVPVEPDWSVLHGWMDRFANRQTVLEPRP